MSPASSKSGQRPPPARRILLLGLLVIFETCGCTLGRRTIVPASVAECREMARMGAACADDGNYAQAESLLEQAIETAPSDVTSRRRLGEVLWEQGRKQEAVVQMETALRLDPTDATLVVRSGEMLLEVKNITLAQQRAEEAVLLDPHQGRGWALRARVARATGQADTALAYYQRALQYLPQDRALLLDVAQIYHTAGEHERCLTTVHYLIDSYPPGEAPTKVLMLHGETLASLERWHQAADRFQLASQRPDATADTWYQLGLCELQRGDSASATASAQRALTLDATHVASRKLLDQVALRATPDRQRF